MASFLEQLFGGNKQTLNKLQQDVKKINDLEPKFQDFSDDQIKEEVKTWRKSLEGLEYEEQQKRLNEIMPEVFALTREASKRSIGKRHFDVQVMGGIVLHQGKIAEMRTGEGKTLTATLPVALNALSGRGVHLVTVNDYLARWHASLMGPVYHALGLSVASIQHEKSFLYDPTYQPEEEEIKKLEEETQGLVMDVKHMRPISRRQAYAADITYGTNNEFGFDYLRDNMVSDLSQMTQREHTYSIVDEVDSILIDEARTPLIISAADTEPTERYYQFAKLVERLVVEEDYVVDEKKKGIALTEPGIEKIEKILNVKNLYEREGLATVHHIEQALRAKALFKRDRDYVEQSGEIIIVDEFTGRLMYGRRYSDGLHQAIEAKEGVKIQQESKTLATITFQNYFRMYKKLAGMTGTAMTESEEFYKIYRLEVVSVPTHRPMIRKDQNDQIYKTEDAKFKAIVNDVAERHRRGQPVLIGTVSIQKNELLSEYLRKAGVPFELLNAKNHEREAQIISQAGRLGAVTVATNIAGRGVDILLGGNPVDPDEAAKVREAGGLHVIGTERHESRRIDNQLRGRAGRQGDPGSSQFFVSVEDDLMRLFAGDRLQKVMQFMNMPEDLPIEHKMVSKSLESAQQRIEGLNFDSRKHVLEYDDIMNRQREVVYSRRKAYLASATPESPEGLRSEVLGFIKKEVEGIIRNNFLSASGIEELQSALSALLPLSPEQIQKIHELNKSAGSAEEALIEYAQKVAEDRYTEKEGILGSEQMRTLEKFVCLQALDTHWMEHLETIDNLRESVGLRSYGQRDPLIEYKRESFQLFQSLIAEIEKQIAYTIYKVGLVQPQAPTVLEKASMNSVEMSTLSVSSSGVSGMGSVSNSSISAASSSSGGPASPDGDPRGLTTGRNDACYCGSGKKFKKCGLLNTHEHQQLMAKLG
jgi:preprotein translocase subunit SecA